jgi:hypothetical protein
LEPQRTVCPKTWTLKTDTKTVGIRKRPSPYYCYEHLVALYSNADYMKKLKYVRNPT